MTSLRDAKVETWRVALASSAFLASAALAVVAGIAIAIASIVRSPGLEGILSGAFAGIFIALLIAVAGGWFAVRIAIPHTKADQEPAGGAEIEASLRDLLDELEKNRVETVKQVNARTAWRVPLGAAAGLALWIFGQFDDDPGDFFDAAGLMIGGGLLGYLWAALALSNRYASLYKSRVLPRLAAGFGDMTWRPAVAPDVRRLRDEGVFHQFDHVKADDELVGEHRGLPISIVELKLDSGSGKNRRTVFDGLLLDIELMRDTQAVTAIVADDGAFGNFRDRMKLQKRQRVALEDPVFERIYEVYGTDQVAARALLHPAFMEKLLALGERPDFGRPLALCAGRKLTFVMPKRLGRNLFEPPSFRKPAASRDALVQLRDDIAAVIAAADAVIDLDHRFVVKPLV